MVSNESLLEAKMSYVAIVIQFVCRWFSKKDKWKGEWTGGRYNGGWDEI